MSSLSTGNITVQGSTCTGNLALFQEIVYKEGRILRRCSAIEEIIKYSKEKGGVLTRTIFEWDPIRDRHYFTGMYNSYILEHKKVFRLKEDLGTEPSFWYFSDEGRART